MSIEQALFIHFYLQKDSGDYLQEFAQIFDVCKENQISEFLFFSLSNKIENQNSKVNILKQT